MCMNNYKVTCFTSSLVKSPINFKELSKISTSSLLILFSRKALLNVLIVTPTYSILILCPVGGFIKKWINVNIFVIDSLKRSGFDMKHSRIKYMYPIFPVSMLRLIISKVLDRNESMDDKI